jgi:hypothetical protein
MELLFGIMARAIVAALFIGSGFATSVLAQSDFYKGKTLSLVVASDAANEYTRDGRLVARHLHKHIPGQPTIVVQNMVGASGITPTNWLFRIAPKDGTVMMLINKMMPTMEATRQPGVQYKSTDLGWIGSMSRSNTVTITSRDSPVKTLEDAKQHTANIGALGIAGTMATTPFVLNRTQATKFKVVSGYKSSAEIMLAMNRGELDGRGTYSWDFFVADHPGWREERRIPLRSSPTSIGSRAPRERSSRTNSPIVRSRLPSSRSAAASTASCRTRRLSAYSLTPATSSTSRVRSTLARSSWSIPRRMC